LLIFVLAFLLFEWLLSGNTVVGIAKTLTSCVGTTKVKIMVSTRRGNYSTPEKNPPRPLERSPASRRPVTLAAFAFPAAAAFGGNNYTVNKLAI
jgi:hypothetical protein